MSKQSLFMLVYDVNVNKGGLNQAMFIRASAFSDLYETYILTHNYSREYHEIEEKLKGQGRVNDKVTILNIYDYYLSKYNNHKISAAVKLKYQQANAFEEEDFITSKSISSESKVHFLSDGIIRKTKTWYNDKVNSIDYFTDDGKLKYTEEYHEEGYLCRKFTYDYYTQQIVYEVYYSNLGIPYLSIKRDPTNKKEKVYLFSEEKNCYVEFRSLRRFKQYWVETLASECQRKPILICDGPGSAPIITSIDSSKLFKVSLIHTNHFDYPYSPGSEIKSDHKHIFKHLSDFDAVVTLTEKQYTDIEKEFGYLDNLTVIPHTSGNEPKTLTTPLKDKNLILMVSRYHPEKRIEDAILSMRRILSRVPNAYLEIYGHGEDLSRLQDIIECENLQKHVKLMGYKYNTTELYAKASVTLLTSRFEAFGLTILESMQQYTPVVAYDIPYGPSDIIQHGSNGYLVKEGDIESLADYVIDILSNKQLALDMGHYAFESVHNKFSFEKYYTKWLHLLRHLA